MAETLPDGFTAPVCQTLLTPLRWNGVPRTPGLLNVLAGVVALVAWHWWWYVPIALAVHAGMRLVTAWDPLLLVVVGRALQSKPFYEA